FALDPLHMNIPGEDANGFRAVAQRSMLADVVKDGGAVTMFPANADEWLRQGQGGKGWNKFQAEDFCRVGEKFGVGWVVLQRPGVAGMDCPYRNGAVMVCRVSLAPN